MAITTTVTTTTAATTTTGNKNAAADARKQRRRRQRHDGEQQALREPRRVRDMQPGHRPVGHGARRGQREQEDGRQQLRRDEPRGALIARDPGGWRAFQRSARAIPGLCGGATHHRRAEGRAVDRGGAARAHGAEHAEEDAGDLLRCEFLWVCRGLRDTHAIFGAG